MPRYYFDLHNDLDATDEEGKDLPDFDAALANAVAEARTMIAATVCQGRIELRHSIVIRDESGAEIHTVRFEDAVTVQRGAQILNLASVPHTRHSVRRTPTSDVELSLAE